MVAKRSSAIVIGAAMGLVSLASEGHHSGAAYDGTAVMRIGGEVVSWRFANPHSVLQIRVTDSDGKESIWSFESHPAGMLAPMGYRRNSFEPNDIVTIAYNPLKDGTPGGGRLVGAILSGGSTLGNVPPE